MKKPIEETGNKKDKFANMTETVWKETNEESKIHRGASNITLKDIKDGCCHVSSIIATSFPYRTRIIDDSREEV